MRTAIVVDDEPITRLDLVQMLEELGIETLCSVMDGFEAVECCRKLHPDYVLMDLYMPVFDGLSAAEEIMSQGLAKCVIIITGYGDAETIERAAQAGVMGYLVKPVERRQLQPVLVLAHAHYRRLEVLEGRAQSAERKLEDTKIIERAKLQLAQSDGITEREAYQKLQKLAMDKRCPMITIAKHVLSASSEREVINRAKCVLMQELGISEEESYKLIIHEAKKKGVTPGAFAREATMKRGRL